MYFVVIVTEKITGLERKLEKHKALSILYRVFTLLIVLVGWVIFRATNLSSGVSYLGAMFGSAPRGVWSDFTGSMFMQYSIILAIAVICCFDWNRILSGWNDKVPHKVAAIKPALEIILLLLLAIISISFTVASTYNPFIYFNF